MNELTMNNSKTKRFTKQRQAILESLKTTYTHPDANWIFKKVSKKIPNISLGTVYRNLNILSQEKIIKELTIQPNITRYEANLDGHYHISCTNCFKIEDIPKDKNCDVDKMLKQKISEKMQYTNISCEILFTGICSECSSKQEDN